MSNPLGFRRQSLLTWFITGIRYLHLDYAIPLPAPEPALAFPHLVELSLSYIFEVPKVLNFLQHTELPQLRSLGILGWQGMDWRALSPLQHGAIDRLTSQLESFSFMPEEEADELEALDLDWGNFTNLRRLALPVANATARILARIPVKLQALRLVPTFSWEEDTRVLENVLTEWAPCMELLHRLVLPEAAKGDERFARLCLAKDLQEVYNLSETDEFYWDACDYFFVWW